MSNPRLRLLFADHLNMARGKYLPASKMVDGASRFSQSTFGLTYDKDLVNAPGSRCEDGFPDMQAIYKAADIRPGWEPDTSVVIGELHQADGSPVPMCGRQALRRAVADWQALGLEPKVGIELETFAFVRGADGKFTPYDTPEGYVYSTGRAADPNRFMDAIWRQAEASGFKLESMTTEFDTPQFEFTLVYDSALKAVDDAFLFRIMAKEVAQEWGVHLTFMPKPILTKGGSGIHINFSFLDKTGQNALADGGTGQALNPLSKGCIAGLMHHHKGMAGLIAPTVNSYQRLKPASMSGYWRNWGGDHRGVTTRISAEGGAKARIEHRMGDGAANPYVLAATVLHAARLGVVNKYPLPPAETGDCLTRHDATEGVADDLSGALDALGADSALCAAVGQMLADNHIAIKRDEVIKTAKLEGDALRDFYINYI
jgi:glutamine synthetase